MGVADGDGERVGSVVALELRFRHQDLQHHVDLLLLAVSDADDRLLDRIWGIFGHLQARARRAWARA